MLNQEWGSEALRTLNELNLAYREQLKQTEEALGTQDSATAMK